MSSQLTPPLRWEHIPSMMTRWTANNTMTPFLKRKNQQHIIPRKTGSPRAWGRAHQILVLVVISVLGMTLGLPKD